ncbi:MAG: alpha/beta hydrolase [Mariprofundus sp.]|nr:alpha/beta hydrolase [Mariprofundus sp.]
MRNRETGGQGSMPEQDNLIGLVYEAVLTPSLWPQLLDEMGHYLNALPAPDDNDTVILDGHAHDALASHFKRAIKIQQKVSHLESITHAFSDILNRLPIGVILVRHDASMVANNDLANTLLDETGHLLFHNNQLQANSLANTRALHAMIRESVSMPQREPKSMSIGASGEETSLWVTASSSIHTSLQDGEGLAVVFIHSPKHQRQIPLAAFAAKHQLSRAETRLAKAMLNGCHTLNNAAEHLGLSKHTVRAQMKSIFSKTGTGGQIELMKKMLTGSSALISEQSSAASLAQLKDYSEKQPAASMSMCLHDGRRLTWREYGAPKGKPVMVFHSLTGSHPDYDIAKNMGLRLIVPERPGSHASDPLHGRTFIDWSEDIRQLANFLGLDSFALIGFSAGTPYVLSCVDHLPKRIHHISLIACMAPVRSVDDLDGMIPLNHTAMRLAHRSPELLAEFMRVFLNDLEQDSSSYFDRVAEHQPATDIAVLDHPEIKDSFLQSFQTAAKENFQQLCDEITLCASDWPLDLEQYNGSASIWHGQQDPLVPISMGRRIADLLINPTIHFLPDEGNYLVYSHWQKILSELSQRYKI